MTERPAFYSGDRGMRTPLGQYRIDYFNQHGERIEGISVIEGSLLAAQKTARDPWPVPGAASYTVMRCVFDSLDEERR